MDQTILIAGAGIGGLTLARSLLLHGFHPLVLERLPALAPIGAGLMVQPNGLRALRCIDLEHAVINRGITLHSATILKNNGRILTEMQMSQEYGEDRLEDRLLAIRRSDLHDSLLTAVPTECIRLGVKVTRFEQFDNRIDINLDDGEVVQGRALVGCDGLSSTVRSGLLGTQPPRFSGYTSWRGICSRRDVTVSNKVCEIWGRGWRFGFTPVSKRHIYWFAVANAKPGDFDGRDAKAVLLKEFSNWCEPVTNIVDSTSDNLILSTDIYDRKPTPTWTKGRVALLGDAAHPMTPDMGQGACQAIEDAVVLANHISVTKSIAQAFRHYERTRYARTKRIVNLSRQFGKMAQLEGAMSCWVRNTLVRSIPARWNRRQIQKLWRFQL